MIMVPTRVVAILLFCFLVTACSSKKTGTVTSLVFERTTSEMLASIKLDDGTEAVALPKAVTQTEGGFKSELVKAGQRVELEPLTDAERKNTLAKWKIVRILNTDK